MDRDTSLAPHGLMTSISRLVALVAVAVVAALVAPSPAAAGCKKLCRQPIAALTPVTDAEGIERCRIEFEPKIILVRPTPRRAFQGWRYLEAKDAPPDLPRGGSGKGLPEKMRRELAELGLL